MPTSCWHLPRVKFGYEPCYEAIASALHMWPVHAGLAETDMISRSGDYQWTGTSTTTAAHAQEHTPLTFKILSHLLILSLLLCTTTKNC